MKINYTRIGDYELPDLTINNKNIGRINRYGRLKLNYLKENNKALYTTLLMNDELTSHLVSVNKECENRFDILIENYRKSDKKLSEKSKAKNPLKWAKLMNNYKNIAEKIIENELIFI